MLGTRGAMLLLMGDTTRGAILLLMGDTFTKVKPSLLVLEP